MQKGNLAGAIEQARASEAQVAAAASRVSAATTALQEARKLPAETSAIAIARSERFITKLRRTVELARDEHARALASHQGQLASVDAARDRLARARADREVIERHFARWRSDRAKLAERRED